MKTEINQNKNTELYKARETVNKKIGFYIHLIVYLLVNLFFHLMNLIQDGPYWAIFPLIFWGMGLGIHFLNVFDVFENSELKRKMILKQLEKQRRK